MYTDREVMEQATNFEEAKQFLSTVPLFGYAYYILGGARAGEGVVITRAPNTTDHIASLNPNDPNGWYVLQVSKTLFLFMHLFDSRRTQATAISMPTAKNNLLTSTWPKWTKQDHE